MRTGILRAAKNMRASTSLGTVAFLFLAVAICAHQSPRPVSQGGSITGRLLGRDGTPSAGVRVSAVPVEVAAPAGSTTLMTITQTDSAGRYRLENVPPGRYFISAGPLDLPSYFPGVSTQTGATVITVAALAEIAGIDFQMTVLSSSGLRLAGRVIIRDSLNPSASFANVNAGTLGNMPSNSLLVPVTLRLAGNSGGTRTNLSANVAADGTFEFRNVPPGSFQLTMPQSVVQISPITITLADKDITDFQLVMPLTVSVSATVTVDGDGLVPRTQVVFTNTNANAPARTVGSAILPGPAVFQVTLATGEYRVEGAAIPPGYALKSITAGSSDLTKESLRVTAAGVAPIRIVLAVPGPPPWVRMSGRIVGRAVPGNVMLNVQSPAVADFLIPILYLDGSFEIPRVLPGDYTVRAIGLVASTLNVLTTSTVHVDSTDINDLVIQVPASSDPSEAAPAGTIETYSTRVDGHIEGRARAPAGASVQLMAGDPAEVIQTSIKLDGSFEFLHVPPATYSARVIPPISGAVPTTITVGSADVTGVRIVVPSTKEINGRAVIEGDGAMPQTLAFALASGEKIEAALQPDGSFRLTAAEPLKLDVAANALPTGYSVQSLTFSGADPNDLRVILKSESTRVKVSGRVTGLSPRLSGSHVWLTGSADSRAFEANINSDGTFEFPKVAAGNYIARLAAPGIPASVAAVAVTVAGNSISDIVIPAPLEVRGRVMVDGNRAAPRFSIPLARPNGDASDTTATIDPQPDGAFTVVLPIGERRAGLPVGLPAGYAIESLTYGGADFLRGTLKVSPDDVSELVIRLR